MQPAFSVLVAFLRLEHGDSPCLLEFEPIAILCGHRFCRANGDSA